MYPSNSQLSEDFLDHLSSFLSKKLPMNPSVDSSMEKTEVRSLDRPMDTLMGIISNISNEVCMEPFPNIQAKIMDLVGIGYLSQSDIRLFDPSSVKKITKRYISP